MEWKVNLLIVVGVLTLIATIIGSFWVVRPMLKKWFASKNSWPLRVEVRKVVSQVIGSEIRIFITLLIEPRKPSLVGKCKMVSLRNNCEVQPSNWVMQELRLPQSFDLCFYYVRRIEVGDEVQIHIESEGYECKSNVLKIPSEEGI